MGFYFKCGLFIISMKYYYWDSLPGFITLQVYYKYTYKLQAYVLQGSRNNKYTCNPKMTIINTIARCNALKENH